jgi:hypothetical protein
MAQQNPFGTSGAGANAFKAAYDRLKSEADLAKQNIGQDYASAYQQLRGQTYTQGLGAAAQKGLSGGQAAGVRGAVSAQQMGALGNLMQGQERALREAKVGEQSIYSNALMEGQQAKQYEREGQQADFQRDQQSIAVIGNNELTDEQKTRSLTSLGYSPEEIRVMIEASNQPGFTQQLGQFAQRTLTPFGAPSGGSVGENFLTGATRGVVGALGGPLVGAYTTGLNLYDFVRNLLAGNAGNIAKGKTMGQQQQGTSTVNTTRTR